MSLAASRNFGTKSALCDRINGQEAEQEILDFLDGCYEINPWELSQEEANWVAENRQLSIGELIESLKAQGKSAGARYIAARILAGARPDEMGQLAKDWWSHRAIKNELSEDELKEIGASAADLRMLGVKTGCQARRFYELYKEVHDPNRVWGSSCQVSQAKVLAIATTPNFNRLPLWVKKGLVKHAPYIHTDRVGDIWRLKHCVKAWKWCNELPKNIAEKIGKRGTKARVIAALAWEEAKSVMWEQEVQPWSLWRNHGDRTLTIETFWKCFRKLEQLPLLSLLPYLFNQFATGTVRCIVEQWMGLPFQSLKDEWPDKGRYADRAIDEVTELIATYGDPRQACHHLFNASGKATVKAFQQCQSKDAWKWASALASGNADAVQKILQMDSLIAWEPDAVDFLLSLPMISRLRMLQATQFKYRGAVCEITADHIRDTGYLWKNIKEKPDLGRIRCWFSVHETLAAAFVKELPDEALPIPAGWERVDGLSAVDGSWELEFPRRVATLKYYGQLLNNCVGGYGPAIKQGRSIIFVVREYGQITHCVEIDGNGDCRQFYQARNQVGDRTIEESVLGSLRQAGLVK